MAKARAKKRNVDMKKVEVDVVGDDAVEIDVYHEEEIKAIAQEAPEVRFKHSSHFTDDEDKIIASSLMDGIALYRIAATLRCHRTTLRRHIDESPELTAIALEALEKEKDEIDEGIQYLRRNRHPAALLWLAERLMPEKYGKDRQTEEEDDTRIVIGAIPEDDIAEGDRILEEAASKPPEAELSAMLDQRALEAVEKKSAGKDGEDAPSLDQAIAMQLMAASAAPSQSDRDKRLPSLPQPQPGQKEEKPRGKANRKAEPVDNQNQEAVDGGDDDFFGDMGGDDFQDDMQGSDDFAGGDGMDFV